LILGLELRNAQDKLLSEEMNKQMCPLTTRRLRLLVVSLCEDDDDVSQYRQALRGSSTNSVTKAK
jgi:hypothetical protein